MINLPNILTISRIVLIPIIVTCYYLPFAWAPTIAASIFALACITDWLDGYLARILDNKTTLGALLDLIADKLLVVVVLLILVNLYDSFYMMIGAMIIISREIIISALREWMTNIEQKTPIKVSIIGKIKTTIQMLALLLMLGNPPYTIWANVGCVILTLAIILTIWSMYLYFKQAIIL